ncbi:polysaccharide deacetylase family protein [Winogradskyella bathintestinalis]|uniref:Polysaccharide deacetylase family protein n=1 Tax=Winogradskyella bathintestinalis TaxID=3035208 RepID=A0ABT7ZXJ0_9FLAO|nr:polysaccharide deacetylase family protein [Winogradskyella bathintestinalis]MDN3493729.1 polysaccharide deacetylase family protein [Winogradskyella bathintestinalis]
MSLLMFHSIGCENEDWYRNWLSVSLDHFDTFCQYLVKENYNSVFLDEWYNSEVANSKPEKQIVLTFDDGYLDNWVYAYPILKKYNLKGTIFINPEFIDGSEKVRYTLDDVWNKKVERNQLSPLGFVNWAELQEMEASGVIDIQSHSMSHDFYFCSNKIKDVYTGQPHYDWMPWIHRPDRKPYYNLENQKDYVPKGSPIFEYDRALSLRRYFPDEELIKYAAEIYSKNKDNAMLIHELNEKLNDYPGRFETDEEMEKRYRYEIFESKRILEEKLNKKIDYFCWPGGGYNKLSIDLCIEAGYKASTASLKNKPYAKDYTEYKKIKRVSMTSFISTSKNNYHIKRSNFLVNLFKSHEGKRFNRNLYLAEKLGFMIKEKISK